MMKRATCCVAFQQPEKRISQAKIARLGLLVAVTLMVCYCSENAQGQGPDEIVWLDEAKTIPVALPEAVLARLDWSSPAITDLSGLRLSEAEAQLLRMAVTEAMKQQGQSECQPASTETYRNGRRWPGCSESVAALIQDPATTLAAVARVVRREPVWQVSLARPGTREVMRIEKLLKRPGDEQVAVGAEVSVLRDYGPLRIGSAKLCTSPAEDWLENPSFAHGLFVATLPPWSGGFAFRFYFFEVRDGLVFPGQSPVLCTERATRLAAIEAELGTPKKDEAPR